MGTNETTHFQKGINANCFIRKYKSLFNFKRNKKRTHFFCFIEIDWYTCREKQLYHLVISQLICRAKCEYYSS